MKMRKRYCFEKKTKNVTCFACNKYFFLQTLNNDAFFASKSQRQVTLYWRVYFIARCQG